MAVLLRPSPLYRNCAMSSHVFFSKSFSIRNWMPCSGARGAAQAGGTRRTGWQSGSAALALPSPVPDPSTFLGSMLNFFLPIATCLFLCMFFLRNSTALSAAHRPGSPCPAPCPEWTRMGAELRGLGQAPSLKLGTARPGGMQCRAPALPHPTAEWLGLVPVCQDELSRPLCGVTPCRASQRVPSARGEAGASLVGL